MNKFIVDKESYVYLQDWAGERKEAAIWSPYWFRKCEIELRRSEADGCRNVRFYVEAAKDYYKFSMKDEESVLFSGKIVHDETGENDFKIVFKKKKKNDDEYVYVQLMQIYITAFLHCNAFMWYGNLVDDKKVSADGRNEGRSKIITFRKFKDELYAIPVSRHRSPDGVFSVRGHFRRYKNGRTVWIDEYLKGLKDEE